MNPTVFLISKTPEIFEIFNGSLNYIYGFCQDFGLDHYYFYHAVHMYENILQNLFEKYLQSISALSYFPMTYRKLQECILENFIIENANLLKLFDRPVNEFVETMLKSIAFTTISIIMKLHSYKHDCYVAMLNTHPFFIYDIPKFVMDASEFIRSMERSFICFNIFREPPLSSKLQNNKVLNYLMSFENISLIPSFLFFFKTRSHLYSDNLARESMFDSIILYHFDRSIPFTDEGHEIRLSIQDFLLENFSRSDFERYLTDQLILGYMFDQICF